MTEISDIEVNKLSPAVERFVLSWGEMGTRWGVNRSVSQIHALLYLSERPMMAEEISGTLGMARSNVSNSIKELMIWGLIQKVHIIGDRRDFYEAETDLWEMLLRISAGRKEREIDPALATLRHCVEAADTDETIDATAHLRIKEMAEFVETLTGWYEQMQRVPKPSLVALMRMGAGITRFVNVGRRKKDG